MLNKMENCNKKQHITDFKEMTFKAVHSYSSLHLLVKFFELE